jgi:hypothetical protein
LPERLFADDGTRKIAPVPTEFRYPTELVDLRPALRTRGNVLELIGIELIRLAECLTGEQLAVEVGHDVTS